MMKVHLYVNGLDVMQCQNIVMSLYMQQDGDNLYQIQQDHRMHKVPCYFMSGMHSGNEVMGDIASAYIIPALHVSSSTS